MNKKSLLIIIGIAMIALVGATQLITTFNNSLSEENLTFTGNENITRNLSISRWATVNSGYLNLSGYITEIAANKTQLNSTLWYIDSVPYSNSTYSYNDTINITNYKLQKLQIIRVSNGQSCGGFCTFECSGTIYTQIKINNTIICQEQDCGSSYPSCSGNISINYENISNSILNISIVQNTGCCHATGSVVDYLQLTDGNYTTENVSLKISTFSQIWNFTGQFNHSNNKTSDFASYLNMALNNTNCNCNGCILNTTNNNCTIPFNFNSYIAGVLGYSYIQINYSAIWVNLTSPLNYNESSNIDNNFSCSQYSESNLSNSTIYIWTGKGCYQESANKSDSYDGSCSLNYSGKYDIINSAYSNNNWTDGNWDSYMTGGGMNFNNIGFYVNYSIPINTSNATWTWKIYDNSGNLMTLNDSLPNLCISNYTLSIKAQGCSGSCSPGITPYCYNGSDYITFGNYHGVSKFYEEAVNWTLNSSILVYSTNKSITGISNASTYNYTFSKNGNYLWNCLAYNNLDEFIWGKDNYTFTMNDIYSPVITILNPEHSHTYNNNNISINYSSVDTAGVSFCTINITNATGAMFNFTSATCANTTANLSDGSYVLNVYSNDTFNNLGNKSLSFSIITSAPAVNLNYPTNNFYSNISTTYFNFTAIDALYGLSACELWGDFNGTFAKNYTWRNPNTGQMNYTTLSLVDSSYLWNVRCNNSLDNWNFALDNFTFIKDTLSPAIAINSITTTIGSHTIAINITTNDTNSGTCNYTNYNILGTVESSASVVCNSTFNVTFLSFDSTYNLSIFAQDLAGNTATKWQTYSVAATGTVTTGGSGGGSSAPENSEWTMTTSDGSSLYSLQMTPRFSRTNKLVFENTGNSLRTITLSCQNANAATNGPCDWVTFSNQKVLLPVLKDTKTMESFTITTPSNISNGDYSFNIYGTDDLGAKSVVSVKVKISSIGIFTDAIFVKIFGSFKLGDYNIPYAALFMSSSLVSWLGAGFILTRTRYKEKASGLSILIGLSLGFILLLLL